MMNLAYTQKGGDEIRPDFFQKILKVAQDITGIDDAHISLAIVDDTEIHDLNKKYRGKDKPTDVLAFAQNDITEAFIDDSENDLGEIIISWQTAEKQASEKKHSYEEEVKILFIHGFLHLLGYDHQTDEEEAAMKEKENAIKDTVSRQ